MVLLVDWVTMVLPLVGVGYGKEQMEEEEEVELEEDTAQSLGRKSDESTLVLHTSDDE